MHRNSLSLCDLKCETKVTAVYGNTRLVDVSVCETDFTNDDCNELDVVLPAERDWNEGVELLATNAATEDIYAIGAVSTADVNPQPPWTIGARI